nr:hypothetical protein B0A51_01006 [Rachicladosporium sp. CCFEE 5018]
MELQTNHFFQPRDRSLPSQDVIEDNLATTYVHFILYCNPQFPLDVDTSQLTTNFNTPPKSDGKDFSTFRLWQLVKQLDAKEIASWNQLAQDLGVEPPDTAKGQSVQKIAQYTVRCKRWMRAMHIDAFFEYLLGKQHAYFLEIPHPNHPYPAGGRDQVPTEEDLAVRALDPSFRPKRGRRRNSDVERDEENEARAKQARASGVDPASAYPRSAMPMSAHPGPHQNDPWTAVSSHPQPFHHWPSAHLASSHSAITPTVPQHLRWQAPNSAITPATPHPMTAHPGGGATNAHLDPAFANEPQSAITPSTAKRKRKHGPAVSSAWPSSTPTGGRPRGRPPASRPLATEPSPFSAFPASRLGASSMSPSADAIAATPEDVDMPPPPLQQPQSAGGSRGHRLSLQVPQHTGGPVRLATPPPPVVTVNGGEVAASESEGRGVSFTPESMASLPAPTAMMSYSNQPSEAAPFTREALHRVLTTDLLLAQLAGRASRLTSTEAKSLAEVILSRLLTTPPSRSSTRVANTLTTAASWLGLGDQLNVPPGAASGSRKKLTTTRFRMSADGYEEIISPSSTLPPPQPSDAASIREVFDLTWTATLGACTATFALSDLSFPSPAPSRIATADAAEADIHNLVLSTALTAASRLPLARLSGLHNEAFDLDGLASRGARLSYERRGVAAGTRSGGEAWEEAGRGADGEIDWRGRCRALEFGTMLAKGEMERYRERILEGVLDLLT